MDDILIPLAFFASLAFVWWATLNAIVRYRMLKEGISEPLLARLLEGEARLRQYGALRWGLVLVAVGGVLALLPVFGLTVDSPAGVGLLMVAGGAAQLAFHLLGRRDA